MLGSKGFAKTEKLQSLLDALEKPKKITKFGLDFEEDINEVKIERKNPNSKKLLLEDSSQSDETSSSEEVLLQCGDTILSQPVVPHENCNASNADYSLINYTVEKDGFYTVIFSSSFEQV